VTKIITDSAPALSSIPPEIGARIIRGPVCYPGHNGSLDVGDLDIGQLLHGLKDQEVLVIIAPLRPVQGPAIVCSLCGTPHQAGECPLPQADREETKRVAEESLLFDEDFSGLLSDD
jgi:hypothetical protein